MLFTWTEMELQVIPLINVSKGCIGNDDHGSRILQIVNTCCVIHAQYWCVIRRYYSYRTILNRTGSTRGIR